MSQSENKPAKIAPKTTGRRYASVDDMLATEGVSHEVRQGVAQLQAETRLTTILAKLRTKHGLTQQQMGDKLGVTQSAISKMEAGRDEDLTLGEVRDYAKALNERIAVGFGQPYSHVEAIKLHAEGMRANMMALTKIASADEQMENHIQKFFGEAFFNILSILASCQDNMPKRQPQGDMRIESVSGKAAATTSETMSEKNLVSV